MWKLIVPYISKSHDQYRLHKHFGLIFLLLSFGMFIMSGCGSLDNSFQPNSSQSQLKQTSTSPLPKSPKTYVVGETFKIGDLQYKLNSVRMSDGNANCDKSPKYGNTFLLLDLTIENQGVVNVEVRSMIGFKLYDKEGRSQAFSIKAAQSVKCELDGTITAGGTMRGELGFEVIRGVQTFALAISPNPFSSETAYVEIPMNCNYLETI